MTNFNTASATRAWKIAPSQQKGKQSRPVFPALRKILYLVSYGIVCRRGRVSNITSISSVTMFSGSDNIMQNILDIEIEYEEYST